MLVRSVREYCTWCDGWLSTERLADPPEAHHVVGNGYENEGVEDEEGQLHKVTSEEVDVGAVKAVPVLP